MPQAGNQSPKIFICYRRDDSAWVARAIFVQLAITFGEEQIFMDVGVGKIKPGDNFVDVIKGAVGECAVLVAVIGKEWLTSRDKTGRRLDNPHDFVRLEIATALANGIRVIPVLLQGTPYLREEDLPEELRALAHLHALELSHNRWEHGVGELIDVVIKVLAEREAQLRATQEEEERRKREEEEHQRREAEEELRQEKEQREREAKESREREEAAARAAEEQERREAEEGRRRESLRIAAQEEAERQRREAAVRQRAEESERLEQAAAEAAARRAAVEREPAVAGGATLTALPDVPPLSVRIANKLAALRRRWAGPRKKATGTLIIAGATLIVLTSVALFWGLAPKSGSQNKPVSQIRNPVADMEFVWIQPGSFDMGSENGKADERPVHRVKIERGFYMGKYEVTQTQWQRIMGNNPSIFKGGDLPVENVSWNDAMAFISQLNLQNDGFTYRLPTEAEWEYACRAGTKGDYAGDLDSMAWYGNNSGKNPLDAAEIERTTDPNNYEKRLAENHCQTHPVGDKSKLPNKFGLFGMHGNVWEWCQDRYHDSYTGAPRDGTAWLGGPEPTPRVYRGGSWYGAADYLRSANRGAGPPDLRGNRFGFRVVAVARE